MEKKSDIKGKISAMLTLIDVSFANKEQRIKGINVSNISGSMLGGSLVTTAWRVLRLRMEGTPSRYGG
jgi:hypothetical protein